MIEDKTLQRQLAERRAERHMHKLTAQQVREAKHLLNQIGLDVLQSKGKTWIIRK